MSNSDQSLKMIADYVDKMQFINDTDSAVATVLKAMEGKLTIDLRVAGEYARKCIEHRQDQGRLPPKPSR